ncbi:MGH1-like glycoside hydrolase domain-containing protein [Sphingomonas sp.]|jgi:hypothetical protein|uniref:MGH1-like glycoside hydrolase domain-containing protein n=1 Tax=Sphingomonas sp. TaxID=28214 RepID=UPI002ED7B0E6
MMPTRMLTAGLLAVSPSAAAAQQATTTYAPYPGTPEARPDTVAVAVTGNPGARRFDLSTSAPQRDAAPSRRTIQESGPFTDTGSVHFDALFAMAADDARRASVDRIGDDAYNEGKPIPCRCFETGEKWHYVWTRDLSYALDLGLADFDPGRAVASLSFKTSALRMPAPAGVPADALQIVQDTGSGGSWPISTDRTAWALGAGRTLANLHGAERAAFARTALSALRGTLEADRIAAFDPRDGLYGGEHSFLDWREQTYPAWIVDDLAAMAQMKALSTNVLQYRALQLAAVLARGAADDGTARRYDGWARALRLAIRSAFWNARAGLFVTYLTADAHPAQVAKYDLLGNDLAIVSGIADEKQAKTILSTYPFAPFGPPVVWPQAPDTFVYHNRAQWPFVSAYTLRAAAQVAHVAAADRATDALMRGAALHLSNMENLEWLTGRSRFDDGPEINSARQLWSVGGYLGAVTGAIFGWHPELDGIRLAPFLTAHMRALLGDRPTATLSGLRFAGRTVDIRLILPPRAPEGWWYPVAGIRLNGAPAPGRLMPDMLLAGGNLIEVTFAPARRAKAQVTEAPAVSPLSHDDPRVFMSATPQTPIVEQGKSGPMLRLAAGGRHMVYRDGSIAAREVTAVRWIDPRPADPAATVCYTVVAVTGLASQPSSPACVRGSAAQTIAVGDPQMRSDAPMVGAGEGVALPTLALGLGKAATIAGVTIAGAGTYAVTLRYDNHVYALNTGITNAVKRLTITSAAGGARTAIVQMPHIRSSGAKHPLHLSSRVYFRLAPGTYTLTLSDFLNMSALQSNASYGGPGGAGGVVNEARIAEVLIDRMAP